MKDFLTEFLKLVPNYLQELCGLFSGPKRYLKAVLADQTTALKRALLFFLVSLAFTFLLHLPWLPKFSDAWSTFGTLAPQSASRTRR